MDVSSSYQVSIFTVGNFTKGKPGSIKSSSLTLYLFLYSPFSLSSHLYIHQPCYLF